jgi:branched-chain amino acid transport system substrate-binding protein
MRRLIGVVAAGLLLAAGCTKASTQPIRFGAVYPLAGAQGPGGVDEHRGVLLAAQLANQDGGVNGRPIQITSVDVEAADAAPAAISLLHAHGIDLVLGSYGSTISAPASEAAAKDGMFFWETGAVAMLPPASDSGGLTFRVPPTGGVLGGTAVSFIATRFAPAAHRDASALRFGVSFVNDIYGRTVAAGAENEIRARGLTLAGTFGYDPSSFNANALAHRIAAAHVDVLFDSGYLDDAVAIRRALVRNHVPLVAAIGTSSSYCMPQFGQRLGAQAVGLFASDKPDFDVMNPAALTPAGAALLQRANAAYRARYGADMSAPALAGFSGAWGLFTDVLPNATALTPSAVADAARAVNVPPGSLPNGSGLRFTPLGSPDPGANLNAASVVEEWVSPGHTEVVWPPKFAEHPIVPMDINP